jgi:nitrile hydratase subunit alpha
MSSSAHGRPLSDLQLRVRALENILTEKGLVDQVTLDTIIEHYEHKVGPHLGARLVAKAWTDPDFRQRLLTDTDTVVAEMGLAGIEGSHLLVKENTPGVHNLVVCTLCSCYPWTVLGLPPMWYKSSPYRARAVHDPRDMLREEFGLEIPEGTELRVWDSNADIRYLVLPMRPAGTESLSEDELAALVSRDAMVGTAIVHAPA